MCAHNREVLPQLLVKLSALTCELDRSHKELGKNHEELERKKVEIENALGRMKKKYHYYLIFSWSIMAILLFLFFEIGRV